MGRLFWKFFLFIWLAQVAGMFGVGAILWFEHRDRLAPPPPLAMEPASPRPPPGEFSRPPPAPPGGRPPPERPGFRIPLQPFVGVLLTSVVCAAGLAWYVARPVRHLRGAFEAMAAGHLDTRIAGRMRRRDELADLGADFDRMGERLESLVETRRRLLHDVSHEMRSPLARLQAAVGIARQQPGRINEALERVERESVRMDRLIGELLALSRLDAGFGGKPEAVDLGELLAAIVEDACFEGGGKGVEVSLDVPDLPPVCGDPELLRRAIENVVRNALRHSPAGAGVVVSVRSSGDGFVCLSVEDSGPGVPAEDIGRIFQPFFRAAPSAGEGYGLGLTIAQRVVDVLGGEISARNRESGGLRVEMRLPISVSPN